MKTGGIGGLFFSIANARFIYRELLASPRLAHESRPSRRRSTGSCSTYVRAESEHAVRATGEIPSHSAAVDALPPVIEGAWRDDDGDRRWATPTPHELYASIDHFHLPPKNVAHPESWAEWHYFNVLSASGKQWAFISYIVGGDVRGSQWGGQIAISVREQGGRTRRFTTNVPREQVRFSTDSADLAIGTSSRSPARRWPIRVDGECARERLRRSAHARAHRDARAQHSLSRRRDRRVRGHRRELSVRVGVRGARASRERDGIDVHCGRVRTLRRRAVVPRSQLGRVARRLVGLGRDARGRVHAALRSRRAAGQRGHTQPFFVYLTDSLGFRALFRPHEIQYEDGRTIEVNGREVRVPSRAVMQDVRGADTLRIELDIEDAIGSDTRTSLIERGDAADAQRILEAVFHPDEGTRDDQLGAWVGRPYPVRGPDSSRRTGSARPHACLTTNPCAVCRA